MNTASQLAHQFDFRGIQVAAPLAIAAPGALYAPAFPRLRPKTQNRTFSRPSGVRLPCGEDIDEDAREDEFINRGLKLQVVLKWGAPQGPSRHIH